MASITPAQRNLYNEHYAQAVRNRAAIAPIDETTLVWAHAVAGYIAKTPSLVRAMLDERQNAIQTWHPCDHPLCQPDPSHEAVNCASYAQER